MITGKWYDRLKWVAQIVLPALGVLYVTLATLWDLPKPQEVAGTILALDTFLGVILGISQVKFDKSEERFDGRFVVNQAGDGTGTVDLALKEDKHPEDLAQQKEVRLKVEKAPVAAAARHRTGKRPKKRP